MFLPCVTSDFLSCFFDQSLHWVLRDMHPHIWALTECNSNGHQIRGQYTSPEKPRGRAPTYGSSGTAAHGHWSVIKSPFMSWAGTIQ